MSETTTYPDFHFKDVKNIKIPIPAGSTDLRTVYMIKNGKGEVIWRRSVYKKFDETWCSGSILTIPYTQIYRISVYGALGGGSCCYTGSGNVAKIISTGGYGGYIEVKAKIVAGTYSFSASSGGSSHNVKYISSGGTYSGERAGTTEFASFLTAYGGSGGVAVDDRLRNNPIENSYGGDGGTTSIDYKNIPKGITLLKVIEQIDGSSGIVIVKNANDPWDGSVQESSQSGHIRILALKKDNV